MKKTLNDNPTFGQAGEPKKIDCQEFRSFLTHRDETFSTDFLISAIHHSLTCDECSKIILESN